MFFWGEGVATWHANPSKPSDLSIQTADWQDKASPIFSEKKTCEKKRTTQFEQKTKTTISNLNYVWKPKNFPTKKQ